MTIPVEALEAAKLAVFNSQLGVDRYDGSPNDYDTDMRAALEAAAPLLMDPIETGREAALAQWHERWRMLRAYLGPMGAPIAMQMDALEQALPVGKAPSVTFQLEPERARRLLEVLRSAGAHPSGLGSYEAANDANLLADDIELMIT